MGRIREQTPPTVSVIIATKNRAADLEVVIEDLLQQNTLPTELIVVDQSARKSYTTAIPIPLRYIHDPELSGAATAPTKRRRQRISLLARTPRPSQSIFARAALETWLPE
jgi:hypothetical protein